MKISIEMTEHDFDLLYATSMQWSTKDWKNHVIEGAFTPMDQTKEAGVNFGHTYAYWFTTMTELILARSFLAANEQPYQELIDNRDDGTPFVITTDYMGHSWRELSSYVD